MALKPEVVKWFYELQKQLKERFDLDTDNALDMCRFKAVHFYRTNEEGEKEPLGSDEPVDGNDVEVAVRYATAERDADGIDYADPMPGHIDDRMDWVRQSQRVFDVTKTDDGYLVMDSQMSDEEMMQIYNDAKEGRLIVSKLGGDVLAANGSGMFISVDKNGMPVFCDNGIARMKDLSVEQIEQFYEKHPELMDKPMRDEETMAVVNSELTNLNTLENPRMVYDRMERAMQGLQGESSLGDDPLWATYENLTLRQLRAGVKPATFTQYKMAEDAVADQLKFNGSSNSYLSGKGLENFMVMDENGQMPLFPDYKELGKRIKAGDLKAMAEMDRKIGEAADKGMLAFCGRDPENPEKYLSFRLAKTENGMLEAENIPTEKPTLPWYKKVFSVFFRADVAKYRADTDSYERFEKMRRAQEIITSGDTEPEVEEQQMEEVPDPKKAAQKKAEKAKLERMSPEERFKYEVAKRIHKDFLDSDSPRMYLKMSKSTVEDVEKDPSFQEFVQSDRVQEAMDKKLNGTDAEKGAVSYGALAQDYMKQAVQKVQEAAKASAAGKTVGKAPAQNAPAQNAAEKKPQAPVMGGH